MINLARMGSIPTPSGADYNPFVEGQLRRRGKQLERQGAIDLEKGMLDLSTAKRAEEAAITLAKDQAKEREIMGRYVQGRDAAETLPLGVVNPRFLEDSGTGPQQATPKRTTAPVERETMLDLARVNPATAESFRLGRQAETQGAEDRTRKMAFEDANQRRLDEAEARAGRKLTNEERQQIVANNLAWFQANTGRMNAGPDSVKLKPIPVSANTQILENIQNAKKAQNALDLLEGKGVGVMKGSPKATGYFKGTLAGMGTLGANIVNRFDSAGTDTRSAIADLGSMVIHDRSGAAVTASEYPRLRPFIPLQTDSPEVAKKKLARFVQVYNETIADQAQLYGPAAGYQESPLLSEYTKGQIPAAIRPPEGATVTDFASEEEANAANLPSGTEITINGRRAVIE